jgi:hypothetical protein
LQQCRATLAAREERRTILKKQDKVKAKVKLMRQPVISERAFGLVRLDDKAAPEVERKQVRRRLNHTGRNDQITIRATSQVVELLYEVANYNSMPLGEVLEQALAALVAAQGNKK